MRPLHALAARAGVDVGYVGWRGAPVEASTDTLLAVLRALGHDLDSEDDAPRALAAADAAWWDAIAPPVIAAPVLPVRIRADLDGDWAVEVAYEDGGASARQGRLFDAEPSAHAWRGGDPYCVRALPLDPAPHGYHRVSWRVGTRRGEARWIAAPARAYGAPDGGARSWGVFAPLYALRSARSGDAGDLGELRRLVEHVQARGGRWVGTLPLLAAFLDEPFEPSPYAPVSRRFWNELYLEVPAPAPIAPHDLVDYRAQYAWKRAAIDELAAAAWASQAAELRAFAARDDVGDYAAFRAAWELGRRSPSREEARAAVDSAPWRTHVYAQWAMDRQLAALGDALYLDLPVGVNRGSYDVWRDPERFVLGLSAGAPPDALFLGGQDWGLPPIHPDRERAAGWDSIIQCVRHHMRHAGMLRVDHVMGLHRLYCVPAGMRATEGAYVRYPAEELYAILCLESHRNRCALAGEDLGTVPDFVPPAMRQHGLSGLFVGQFVLPGELAPAPTQVSSMNTHDTPTFGGWWRGVDIDDKLALGLIDDAQAARERTERASARRDILARLGADAALDPDSDAAAELALLALMRRLAASDTAVVLATLEDAWLEPRPQNVPGTAHERPNWRRPFALAADRIYQDERVERLLATCVRP